MNYVNGDDHEQEHDCGGGSTQKSKSGYRVKSLKNTGERAHFDLQSEPMIEVEETNIRYPMTNMQRRPPRLYLGSNAEDALW